MFGGWAGVWLVFWTFLALKLAGVWAAVSWWWIFSPLWIAAGLTAVFWGGALLVVGVVALVAYVSSR